MTIQIPDDLARDLEGIARQSEITVEQLAIKRLQTLTNATTSPRSILAALKTVRRPSLEAVDDLEASIASATLAIRESGVFDHDFES